MGHYSRHLHALTQESAGTYQARKARDKKHAMTKFVQGINESYRDYLNRVYEGRQQQEIRTKDNP